MNDVGYTVPRSVHEALAALRDLGAAATIVAGGQDVVPLMNQGRLTPSHLLDVSRLNELSAISGDGVITIGALVTHAALERDPLIRRAVPVLSEAAGQIGGGLQVRNRGTIGGAVSAANPAYDLPACLVALGATFVLASIQGGRRVPAASFFTGAGRTARRPDELLVAIEVPACPPRSGGSYVKLKFTEGGYTIAGAACILTLGRDGTCRKAAVVLSGVTATPLPLPTVASRLAGAVINADVLQAAGDLASQAVLAPIADVMADGRYRRAMAAAVASRAVERAAARAGAGGAA